MAGALKKLTLDDVKAIVGRALIDAKFRESLQQDASKTLLILGFESEGASNNFFTALISNNFKATADEIENRLGGRPVVAAWL